MEEDITKYKAALKKAANKIEELSNKINEQKSDEDIAIIGYSCRFPGLASNPEKFWDVLVNGIDTVTEIKEDRFDYRKYYSENVDEVGKMNTKYGAFLNAPIEEFDNVHFGISAIEASSIDPQHRLLMEVSWEAMENSALNIEKLKGSRTGVFVGINSFEYGKAEMFSGNVYDITPYTTAGTSLNSASGRLSYFYDFKGPAITCDTACSSSIVALNLAIDSLRNNQCDMAIVGGSNLLLLPESFIGLSKFNGLSKDGRCKSFDDSADGFGRGEGCGVVILKRLKDAKVDRNNVVALVKGVCVGQDGKSNGFTAPNGIAQQKVMNQALINANLTTDDLDYIETHGTGTALGDFIEAQAISEVFKKKKDKMLIGSVKSNLGHLEAASGMASLIKVIMAIEKKKIPPTIHFKKPNHNINWDKIRVVDKVIDWEKSNGIRRAGISSFGFSGTLVHAIIEEPQTKENEQNLDTLPYHIITLSTKNEKSLKDYIHCIKEHILQENSIEDVAYSTNISRSFLKHRFAVSGKSKEEFVKKLEKSLSEMNDGVTVSKKNKINKNKIAFLFTGQGSIYKDIAKDLYMTSRPFKEALDLCNNKFRDALGISLLEAIYGEDDKLLNSPLYSQPTIFSIEYALTKVWDTLGVRPNVVIGHSIGEYAAACYAGLISLDDSIVMIAQRGKLMESIDIDGKMVGVLTDVENVRAAIEESGCQNVSIAAINAPNNVTISGLRDEVDIVVNTLQRKERIFINKLNISHPYHSSIMKSYANDYDKNIGDIKFSNLKINMISSISGKLANEEVLGQRKYWVDHLSNTVEFQSAIETAKELGVDTFIEIGGDATLTGLANQCIEDEDTKFLPSLRNGVENYIQLFESIATLFLSGMDLNWDMFYRTYKKNRVNLPNYQFQRKRFWRDMRSKDIKTEDSDVTKLIPKDISTHPYDSSNAKSKESIELELKEMIHSVTWLEVDEIEKDINLFSLGLDSLVLVTFNKKISSKYNLSISLNEFFTNLDTIEKIAEYIYENIDHSIIEDEIAVNKINSSYLELEQNNGNNSEPTKQTLLKENLKNSSFDNIDSIHQIFNNQMQILSEQLEIIKSFNYSNSIEKNSLSRNIPNVNNMKHIKVDKKEDKYPKNNGNYYVPYKKLDLVEKEKLSDLKFKYLKSIEKKYTNYTKNSKENTQRYRKVYANNRNVAGFRPILKEMIYQIVAEKGSGSKLYDIDGNEMIDLTMGFGVNLFGHNPNFVEEALKEEILNGMPLGPMGRLAGQVAEQISELTGVERVAFYNSGTEANMVAVRLARAITGRKKIVVFSGSYHGTYDGLLGLAAYSDDGSNSSIPLAPGIVDNMVKDLIILNYNSEEALEFIKNNSSDIAGVMVETVQSRRPDVQPKEFLQKLRQITDEEDIALIFDEIITGFRIAAGGAQEYFGIQADIATYGKVAGGGMPVGIVAGKSKYLDSIDGGMWSYGDNSVPPCEKKRTFVAGTFSHHPLAMAAANASLQYIKENKDIMYKELNERTSKFVDRINTFFKEENVHMKVVSFGSLFRFVLNGDFEIFFYGLIEKGIYIWEGRNCFFSTEHSDEDIEKIVSAIKLTIEEMMEAGYFSEREVSLKSKQEAAVDNLEQSIFPMSLIQQRIYTQSVINEQDPYNIISVLKLNGEIDCGKLESAINEIIRRHESLRTRLYVEDGQLKQEVLSNIDFKITKIKKEDSKDLNELIEESITNFSLEEAPLFKVTLINTGDNEGVLIFNFHHTIADGISMDIFVQELIKLYSNEDLLPMNKQYRDFIEIEKNYLDSDEIKASEKYWLNKLSGDLNVLSLPTDYPIESKVSFTANTVKIDVGNDIVSDLKVMARRNKCSLYMVLVATFNILLKKLSGNDDILIGTPVTNRGAGSFDDSIGMFTNTMLLRNNISDEKVFEAFLSEVRQNCSEAYSHMYYPFNFLADNINRDKNNVDSLTNVMFVYENVDKRVFSLDGLEISPYEYKAKVSEFDFMMEILEENGNFNISLTYKTSLFKEDTISRWGEYYKNILSFILNNNDDDFRIKDIEIIGEAEACKIMREFNSTESDYPKNKTIAQLFEEQVEKTPNNIAVVYGDTKVTYKELNEKSNGLAKTLQEKGVEKDVVVGIMANRSTEIMVGIMAILKAGGAYLPLDPEYPEDRIRYMISNSQVSLVLTDTERGKDGLGEVDLLNISNSKSYSNNIYNLGITNDSKSLAYVIYTSGTTGTPKGVEVIQKNVVRLIKNTNYIEINEGENLLQTGSITFDASTFEFWGALLNGATLHIVDKDLILNHKLLENYLIENKITILWLTSALFNKVCEENSKIFRKLRCLLVGGDVVSPKYVNLALKNVSNLTIVNGYGPTENTTFSTCYVIKEAVDEKKSIPIGKPISNTTAYILDNSNNIVPVGVVGELYLSGEGLARGYINNKELTKEKFVDNPYELGKKMYKTGDLARWLLDGNIEFLGRIDNQVKIRGFRIELGEIENALLKIEGIKEAVVVDREEQGNKYLCAYYVSEKEYSIGEIREELKLQIPSYMMPSYFIQVKEMPLTQNGKVDKRKLPIPDGQIDTGVEYEEPRNEIEKMLVKVWGDTLNSKRIGINDDFFSLGGDSIRAIQLISRTKANGYVFEVDKLYKNQTIKQLSKHIKKNEIIINQEPVIGEVKLTPIQKWFFEAKFEEENHWNQAVMLYKKDGFNEDILKEAFNKIITHHDALRMIYKNEDEKILQVNRGIEEKLYDLNVYEEMQEKEVIEKCNEIQSSIDLENGPLVKLGLFKASSGDNLLIAIHHLVIDGVSWRILFEDLGRVYAQIEKGEKVTFQEKTTSFKEWSEKQSEYSNSYNLIKQVEYWNSIESEKITKLPKDNDATKNELIKQDFNLDRQDTVNLLQNVNKAYNTEINDLLLSGLALTISNWTKDNNILINLEGHGREEIIEDVDISRTVGWFTSQYPVILKSYQDISETIKNTKDSLRRIPNKGMTYGIIKHLSKENIDCSLVPEISFNYLGQTDSDMRDNIFKLSSLNCGDYSSKNNRSLYALDIEGIVVEGELNISITYRKDEFYNETIEKLISDFKKNLLDIINNCMEKEVPEITVSDITKEQITLDELKSYKDELDNIKNIYPLAPMQKGILYHNLMEEKDLYNVIMSLQVEGYIDLEILDRAFNRVIERHDILRTKFDHSSFKESMQVVYKNRKTKVEYIDISSKDCDKEEYVKQIITQYREKGFDLNRDILIKLILIKMEDNRYGLVLNNHHILMDGWCVGLIISELFKIYNEIKHGYKANLNNIVPYSNYIEWLKNKDILAAKRYWESYLKGYSEVTKIPFEKENKNNEFSNKETLLVLDEEKTKLINNIAEKNKVTVNTVMQSVWALLLKKYNNSNDIVYGYVVSGRSPEIEGIEDILGLFINTIPLRVKPTEDMSYQDLLRNISDVTLENNKNDYLDLAEIQNLSEVKNELINNILVFENYPIDEKELNEEIMVKNGLKIFNSNDEVLNNNTIEETNYNFNIAVTQNEKILINFKYNEKAFSSEDVSKIKVHFEKVLDQIIKNNNIKIQDIEILETEEKNKLLYEFNNTTSDYPKNKTIAQLFEEQVEKTPNNIAVVYGDTKVTYKELNEKSNSLAKTLQEKGVEKDVVVGVMANRSVEMMAGIIAILKAGGAYLPLDPEYPEDRIKYMISNSQVSLVLTDTERGKDVLGDVDVLNISNSNSYSDNIDNLGPTNDSKSLAYVIYTSGTTGTPKGVEVIQKNVVRLIKNTNYIEINEGENLLQTGSITFDASTFEFWGALLNGAALHIVDKDLILNDKLLEKYLIENKITILWLTSALFNRVCEENPKIFRELRCLLVGGDVVSPKYVNLALNNASNLTIINGYGPTENTTFSTCYVIKEAVDERKSIPIGKPISNTTAYILDNSNNIVPVGVVGELYLSGEGLARGYINNKELTKEKFVDNPYELGKKMYKTGDLVRWLPDGNIEFLGRIDNQVKIRGFRIELGEIENSLLKIEGIKEVVVIDREEQRSKYLCAYYVSEKEYSIGEIRDKLKMQIPSYMIPSYFIKLKEMPLTQNGKVDKRKLPIPDGQIDTGVEYEEPRNEMEKTIVEIWEKVLGTKKVGINDGFFDLGGDSIKAIQVIAKMNSKGYSFELKDLFANPTIKELISHIKQAAIPIDQSEVNGEIELTPIQKWFFEQEFLLKDHFNQELMLFSEGGFEKELVEAAFNKIIKHHDVLRAVYVDGKVVNKGISDKLFEINIYDLRGKDTDSNYITSMCTSIQSSMNLEKGPLVKLGLFKTDEGDHLLVAIHHLVIDAVSWRIILEDFNSLYYGLKDGDNIELPSKTTSFKEWAEKQKEYADSNRLKDEIKYWNKQNSVQIKKLFKDFETETLSLNTAKSKTITLNSEDTKKLLTKVNRAYSTEINDILLSALALTIGNFNDSDQILLNLESHGREEIIDNVYITRTVGWFTSQFPVVLENKDSISELIKNTKDVLRRIPNKGIGYGILKYLSDYEINDINKPEISFNYLGQLDDSVLGNNFGLSNISTGESSSKESERAYSLDISGIVTKDELKFTVTYNNEEYKDETIEALLQSYKEKIKKIIDHCVSKERVEITASDITNEDISLEELKPYSSVLENIKRIYPLTPMQEGLLYHSEIGSGEAYHVTMEIKVAGELSVDIFNKSFNELVSRYDILRTNFDNTSFKENMQIVYKTRKVDLEYKDIRNINSDKEEYITNLIKEDRQKGFDLSKDMLMRLFVVRLDEKEYSLILSNHHIILDGWSFGIISGELFNIYNSIMLHHQEEVKKEVPYEEYIKWLKSKDKTKALSYWSEYLNGYNNNIKIPFKKEKISKGKPKEVILKIDKARTKLMESVAKDNNVTMNTVLQSILAIQLQRYNNIDDVVFGFIVSGRTTEISGIDEMIGLFINTVPLRVNTRNEKNYSKLIKKMQLDFNENEQYRYSSIAEIQNLTDVKDGLVNTLMVFENYPIDKDMINKDILEKANIKIGESKSYEETNYSFNLKVLPGEEMLIIFDYNDGEYSEEAVNKIKCHFENILNQIIQNSNMLIDEIEIVDEAEKQQILVDFNNTNMEFKKDTTIQELFEYHVSNNPQKTAVLFEEKTMSYEELNMKANSLAAVLKDKGVGSNSIIPIMIDRSFEMVIGILAILKSGAAYLPIDIEYPDERVNYILNDSNAEILLTTSEIREQKLLEVKEILDLDNEELYTNIIEKIENVNNKNHLAYVIYTSGTTGKPKGTMIEHNGAINLKNWFEKELGIGEDEKILQFASIAFDAFSWELVMSLLLGNTLCIPPKDTIMDPDLLNAYIKSNDISTVTLPPFIANNLDENNGLRRVITAGSEVKTEQVSHLLEKVEVINAYGPTEDTICTTYYKVQNENGTRIPIGKPIKNHRILILDNNNKLVPIGVEGEICILGEGLARGYLNNEELTNKKFIENPYSKGDRLYKTGDVGRWLPNGDVEYLGRIDHQVKIRGFRIEIGEIEESMLKMPNISEVVIIDREKDGIKYLCAYYVSEDEIGVNMLRETLMKSLPKYMIPSYFIRLDKLPLNTNGKVDRTLLPEIQSQLKDNRQYEEPKDEIEHKILSICKEVLGLELLGVKENLFEVGADSIRITRICKELKKENINISIRDIFYYENVRDIYKNCINEEKLLEESEGNKEFIDLDINEIKQNLSYQINRFNDAILGQNIVKNYTATAMQEVTRETNKTYSGVIINFDYKVNVELLKKSIVSVINTQGLLRSTFVKAPRRILSEANHKMEIQQHNLVRNIDIPYLNLENANETLKEHVKEYIIDELYRENLENKKQVFNKILYKVIIIKLSNTEYKVYMPFNHMIFDGMSMEIIKANILKAYSNNGGLKGDNLLGYDQYVNQLIKGPQEITEEEIIEKFNLNNFRESFEKYHQKFKSSKLINTTVSIELTEDVQKSIRENQWDMSLKTFMKVLELNFGIDNIPLAMIYPGRKYQENNYYNTIGEFIDILPLSVQNGELFDLDNVRYLMNLASKKNINFLTLMCNKNLKAKYKKISKIFKSVYTGKIRIPIFNYLDLYDTQSELEELDRKNELYKTKDLSTEIIMMLQDDKLIIRLFCEENKIEYIRKELEEYIYKLCR